MRLSRAVIVVLARHGPLTFRELLAELLELEERGFLEQGAVERGVLEELIGLGVATRVLEVDGNVNGNVIRLSEGVRRDEYYWGIIRREMERVYRRSHGVPAKGQRG